MPALYGLREHGTDILQSELHCAISKMARRAMAIRMFKSIEFVDLQLGILDYTWFAKKSITVQLDKQSTSYALHSARVRNPTAITHASSFIHCAFGLEKEHVQVDVT